MPKHLLTLRLDPTEANLAAVKRKLNLKDDEIDPNFGIVSISPADHLYAILVDEAAEAKVQGSEGVKGPYSNPKIEPFGPPTT